MTKLYRHMSGKVRSRWHWPPQLCCWRFLLWTLLCWGQEGGNKKKNEKVLFHLGSNLWLGLPALAKLKIWSWLSVAWLAALCQHCCMSKTDQVKHLTVSSGLKTISMLFFPSACLNIDLLLLFSLSCPCKNYLSLPLMFQRSNTENVN